MAWSEMTFHYRWKGQAVTGRTKSRISYSKWPIHRSESQSWETFYLQKDASNEGISAGLIPETLKWKAVRGLKKIARLSWTISETTWRMNGDLGSVLWVRAFKPENHRTYTWAPTKTCHSPGKKHHLLIKQSMDQNSMKEMKGKSKMENTPFYFLTVEAVGLGPLAPFKGCGIYEINWLRDL